MMSDRSPSMGDEVFMTRKSESGKTKNFDFRETTKSGFSAFWKQTLQITQHVFNRLYIFNNGLIFVILDITGNSVYLPFY